MDDLLREQAAYYRAHAGEYDLAYEKLGPLDALMTGLPITGDVLELACGTGQWTRLLAARGHRVTAVDGSPEMLARARERVAGREVEFLSADLFAWRAPRRFDTVFFGFWLSHVPASRFAAFWEMVGEALKPGGRACFIDSSTGDEEALPGTVSAGPVPAGPVPGGPGGLGFDWPREETARRLLADGSVHRIVKVLHDPAGLTAALGELGWTASIGPVSATLLAGEAHL